MHESIDAAADAAKQWHLLAVQRMPAVLNDYGTGTVCGMSLGARAG